MAGHELIARLKELPASALAADIVCEAPTEEDWRGVVSVQYCDGWIVITITDTEFPVEEVP